MTVLFESPALLMVASAVLGLVLGSFLNVVIHRVPIMMEREWRAHCAQTLAQEAEPEAKFNLFVPRSACPHCGHVVAWYENIPILSYLWLRGRCSACSQAISKRYPLIEFVTAALFAVAAWHLAPVSPMHFYAALVLLSFLIALACIDLDTYLLPDSLTMPLLWIGLLLNLNGLFVPLAEAVMGAVAGYLVLWSVYWLFKLSTGKEGMGYGDFKLLAALGAWFGWKMLLPIVLLSSLAGAVIGIAMILLAGHDRAKPIPFGPYLVLGGMVSLFLGQELLGLYLPA